MLVTASPMARQTDKLERECRSDDRFENPCERKELNPVVSQISERKVARKKPPIQLNL